MATPLAAISAPIGINNNPHLFLTQYNTAERTAYAVGNDIMTKKVIHQDIDGKLKFSNSSDLFKDAFGKVFKYLGEDTDEIYRRLFFHLNKEVPDDFIYKTITNKKLLDNDQIKFDTLFEEVNYKELQEKINTECHSLMEEYRRINKIEFPLIPVMSVREMAEEDKLLEGTHNISVYCHPMGYYAQNDVTGRRTGYYDKISEICIKYLGVN